MNLHHLTELRRMAPEGKNLGTIWDYFLTNLGENSEFMAMGEFTRHAFLEAFVEEVSKKLFPKDGKVHHMMFKRIEDPKLVHGSFFMGHRPGGLFYFEDDHVGLLSVPEGHPSIEVRFLRFTGRSTRDFGPPSRN